MFHIYMYVCVCIYIYIYILSIYWMTDVTYGFNLKFCINLVSKRMDCLSKLKDKLATVVEGDPKAPFSTATTPRCRGGRYSFPWIAQLYPWYILESWVLSKEVSSTIFKVFGMTRTGIEPLSPGPLVDTPPTRAMN